MLTRTTPLAWRGGFTLHRRRQTADSYGDPVPVYDMEHPDFTAQDGTEAGICWQHVRTWQSSGALRSGAQVEEYGERCGGVLEGVLYGDLELDVFDRLVVDGVVYELRAVQGWPGHRKLQLQRLR